MGEIWSDITSFFSNYGWKILSAIAVLIVFGFVIHFIIKLIQKILYATKIDNSVVIFITSVVKIILWILLIFICSGIMELSTSSFVVALSSVALSIGLALKDTISNLANGVLIICNKPFKRDDLIDVDGIEGKVQNIKLFSTEIITFDNKKIIIPNTKIATATVINNTTMPTRRLTCNFSVAYGSDLNLVEKVLKEVTSNNKLILKYPLPTIFLKEHSASELIYELRVWTENTDDYWNLSFQLPRQVYDAFLENDIEIPFGQLDVHIKDNDSKKVSKHISPTQKIAKPIKQSDVVVVDKNDKEKQEQILNKSEKTLKKEVTPKKTKNQGKIEQDLIIRKNTKTSKSTKISPNKEAKAPVKKQDLKKSNTTIKNITTAPKTTKKGGKK